MDPSTPPTETISAAEQKFEELRRKAGFFLAPIGFLLTLWWASSVLPAPAARLSAVLALMVIFWLTESIPLPVTALLGAVLNIVLGVADAKTVLSPFADPIIFIFIGGFMLSRAMMRHRLDRRIALAVLSFPGVSKSPFRILGAMGLVTALVSMWVSNTATTAIFLPIALGVLGSLTGGANLRSQTFATGLMLMLAYAASIGGIVTPVGSPPNLIALGQLEKLAGIEIGFLTWVLLMVPIFLAMFGVLWVMLWFLHPGGRGSGLSVQGGSLAEFLANQRTALGGWTAGQVSTAAAFGVAVVLWLLPGVAQAVVGNKHDVVVFLNRYFPESIVALLAACLLFFLPGKKGERALDWEEASKIDWGIILLFGGGISLGALMFSTGVAKALGETASGLFGPEAGLWALTGLAIVVGIVLSETTSNTSSATMLCPVVIALADGMGVSPVAPTLGACLGASMGFMLPVSTPPNAIVYGSGLVPLPAMLRAGIIFDILGFLVIWGGLRVLCPLLGLA
jgi:sodium-dependent dicarboxylate transporter 2/3/5